jgi:hypothetical protein
MKISKIKAGTNLAAQFRKAKVTFPAAGVPSDDPHVQHMARAQELREGGWTHHKTKLGKFWRHAATNRTALNSTEALKMHRATRKPI